EWQYGLDYYRNGTVWLDTVTAEPLTGNAPAITSQTPETTIEQGQPVTLSIAVTGDAPLSYQWFYDGDGYIGGATNSTLELFGNVGDAGAYTAVAQNVFGSCSNVPINVAIRPSSISLR